VWCVVCGDDSGLSHLTCRRYKRRWNDVRGGGREREERFERLRKRERNGLGDDWFEI
jgi:hypothetical protein